MDAVQEARNCTSVLQSTPERYSTMVAAIRRPGRPAMGSGPADSLPVRLDPELRQAHGERATADNTTASDIVREALRRYLKIG